MPGFASRHDNADAALRRALEAPAWGFAPFDPAAGVPRSAVAEEAAVGEAGPRHFSPEPVAPKHFAPAERVDEEGEFVDPIAAAHAAGFADGMAAATSKAAADAARDRALMETLRDALVQGRTFDREQVARQLRQTVLGLVTRLIGEAGLDGARLAARVSAAVDLLADSAESAILRLNPADLALVEGHLPANVFAIGDAAVARGALVLESASTTVEDGPALWLDQLGEAIDRCVVPSC